MDQWVKLNLSQNIPVISFTGPFMLIDRENERESVRFSFFIYGHNSHFSI